MKKLQWGIIGIVAAVPVLCGETSRAVASEHKVMATKLLEV